jgi:CHAD domain-containing protein
METLEKLDTTATAESEAQPDFGDTPGAPLRLAMWRRGQELLHQLHKSRHDLTEAHVHDCRVASRRLQFCLEAVLDVTGKKPGRKIRRDLRYVQKNLARVRDLHIQQSWLTRHPELAELSEHVETQQHELLPRTARSLREVSLKKLELKMEGLDVYLAGLTTDDESFEHVVQTLVGSVQKTLQDALALIPELDSQHSQSYHPLRLQLKKFRYQVELLAELPPSPTLPHLEKEQWDHLKSLHQTLGIIQDVEVLCHQLDRFWARNPPIRRVQHRIFGLLLKERDRYISGMTPEHMKLETLWKLPEEPSQARSSGASLQPDSSLAPEREAPPQEQAEEPTEAAESTKG